MSHEAPTGGDQSVDKLRRELAEAREQQAATAGILAAISSSPADLPRVFAEIAASAARLCDASNVLIGQLDGDSLRLVASHGPIPTFGPVGQATLPLSRGDSLARAVLDRQTIHVPDIQVETAEYPQGSDMGHRLGIRTLLHQPLIRAGEAIGVISIRRADVRPFTERQIELLKTFADQAVIAIENTRLFEAEQTRKKEVEAKSAELRESLEYQIATSDVLNVISRSKFELQPVLDTIVETAARLCRADMAHIRRREGDVYVHVAGYGEPPGFRDYVRESKVGLGRGSIVGRVLLEKKAVQIPDVLNDSEFTLSEMQRRGNFRTVLGVPLTREGVQVGIIVLLRHVVEPFTKKQIELVTTFADQAVIAIENTRLFDEVQARTRELQEALEQQVATSKILNVISGSPGKLEPVFDTILTSARQLCAAEFGHLLFFNGETWRAAALHNVPKPYADWWNHAPVIAGPETNLGRVQRTGRPDQVADVRVGAGYTSRTPLGIATVELGGARTLLSVPLLKDGDVIGCISLYRGEVRPFDDGQIELLSSFAEQAAIAIENTRLFEAEQVSKRELQQSLEYQTATSEVLKVISRSPNELQPVFDVIAQSASRLCGDEYAIVARYDGELLHLVAQHNPRPGSADETARWFPQRPVPPSVLAPAVTDSAVVHISDIEEEELPQSALEAFRRISLRAVVAVPMIHESRAMGAIAVSRATPGAFPQRQIDLLRTFADQAVIAIENTRLFEEVQARTRELTESLQQQTGTADVLKVISRSAFDLKSVLQALVESAARLCDADKGTITRQINGVFYRAESYGFPAEVMERWGNMPVTPDRGSAAGRALLESRTVHVPDADADPDYTFDAAGVRMRSMLGVPMLREGVPIGVLALARSDVRPFTDKQIDLVSTFADQAAIAIENVRLFEEVQARTSELAKTIEDLEIASQHKSQFVANMSHELRTPLAAILGYAELIQEGFYEPQGPKSLDALARIRSNGKHLLGLINTVLDVAKIESGQFTLNLAEYAIESVVETVRSATESLAQYKNLAFKTEVPKSLPVGLGDEQRLTQVLLNLVGNAIKFTDAGEVRVTAKSVNGHFNVTVADTGPGIPPAEQARIFEQFHQVDSSLTKAKGGTGLGLAIAKQIVELHGGRIWVESTVGKGSAFQMEIPTRAELQKHAE